MISYTSAANVFALGDVQNASAPETAVLEAIVPAISRQIDTWLNMVFAQQTYTAHVERAQIDVDGVLQCWPAVPTMQAPSAIAWKLAASPQWYDITSSAQYDIYESTSGCQFRVLTPNLIRYRGQRVLMRLTYVGGWATLGAVPADFEYATRRACWIEYKKRDQGDMGKTAIPELGIITVPSAWPADIKRAFETYKRVVLI